MSRREVLNGSIIISFKNQTELSFDDIEVLNLNDRHRKWNSFFLQHKSILLWPFNRLAWIVYAYRCTIWSNKLKSWSLALPIISTTSSFSRSLRGKTGFAFGSNFYRVKYFQYSFFYKSNQPVKVVQII